MRVRHVSGSVIDCAALGGVGVVYKVLSETVDGGGVGPVTVMYLRGLAFMVFGGVLSVRFVFVWGDCVISGSYRVVYPEGDLVARVNRVGAAAGVRVVSSGATGKVFCGLYAAVVCGCLTRGFFSRLIGRSVGLSTGASQLSLYGNSWLNGVGLSVVPAHSVLLCASLWLALEHLTMISVRITAGTVAVYSFSVFLDPFVLRSFRLRE